MRTILSQLRGWLERQVPLLDADLSELDRRDGVRERSRESVDA